MRYLQWPVHPLKEIFIEMPVCKVGLGEFDLLSLEGSRFGRVRTGYNNFHCRCRKKYQVFRQLKEDRRLSFCTSLLDI